MPISEKAARAMLLELQTQFDQLNSARQRKDAVAVKALEPQVIELMLRIGDACPNESGKRHWYERAQDLQTSSEEEKDHVMLSIGKGMGIILLTPFVLVGGIVGGAFFAAGKGVQELSSRFATGKPKDRY